MPVQFRLTAPFSRSRGVRQPAQQSLQNSASPGQHRDAVPPLRIAGEPDGKASSEIVSEIGNLREALADVDLPAQAETALQAIEASARQLDDIVPDAPAPDAPPAPTE
jgi:hypothetical protein